MEAEIRISSGDDVTEFSALWDWLRRERELAGSVRAGQRPPGERELGGAVDVLAVALGSGGAGVTLARSLVTWLRTRRSDVSITVTTPAGKVVLKAHRVNGDDAVALLQELLRARDDL